MTEAKNEDQWARGHQSLYMQFISARSARFPPRDHPLTLFEWFVIHHKNTWGPFIQKEIKLIRYFHMFNDYSYLNNLPEVQLGQLRQVISLLDLNASQARSNQPPLSAAEFLDLNSIHLVRDPFDMWVERYKVYVSMKKELKCQQIIYPISIDQFLQHASFGTSSTYKMSLSKDEYGNFVEAQRQLHIQRMALVVGPSYSMFIHRE
ncbi:hypothetical protein Taro_016894 [Colocasia esculenta]|uniref:Uncharacterized protein n=1 Tax=Colocasia esculenta TaxID=4460 RepID=A0A843UUD3_COLES|nr:hypothetical protein [Colocasia esculenta]